MIVRWWLAVLALAALLGAVLQPAAVASARPVPLDLPPPPVTRPRATARAPTHPGLDNLLARLQRFPQTRPRGSVALAVTAGDGAMLAE